ncbi:hypothetical protein N8580_03230 [Akkermansiaceae bacterium]|nr:hypothetical protein [Akkermansiaceae bacterium]
MSSPLFSLRPTEQTLRILQGIDLSWDLIPPDRLDSGKTKRQSRVVTFAFID